MLHPRAALCLQMPHAWRRPRTCQMPGGMSGLGIDRDEIHLKFPF